MINWQIKKKSNYLNLEDGTIKLGNSYIVFSKQALTKIIKRFSNGKGIMLGIQNASLYLKDDPNGYKLRKASSYYMINIRSNLINDLNLLGIKQGIYTLEDSRDNTYKCIFLRNE